MGSLAESSSLQTIKMMKSIAVVALCMFVAVAGEAEASADAGYLYGHYGYGHLGYAHHGYYGYPYARHYGHYYGKRSADAEPTAAAEPKADADAFYGYYGHPLAYAPMDTDMPTMDTTMARGLLMLSPPLMLPMDTMDMDITLGMPTMDTMDTHMPAVDTSMDKMDIIINLFVKNLGFSSVKLVTPSHIDHC